MDKVAILILNWNGKKDTIELLHSLDEGIPIVIDNGSTDDSVSALRAAFPGIHIIETKRNLGFAGGNNVGIRYALHQGYSHILLLNNDTTVERGFLKHLLAADDQNTILGCKLINAHKKDTLDHLGGMWNPKTLHFDHIGTGEHAETFSGQVPLDYVCGCALFAHHSVFERVGLLSDEYFMYWEDADFCMRAKKMGIPSVSISDAVVYHKGAMRPEKKSLKNTAFYYRNRTLFLKNHGLLTDKAHKKLRQEKRKRIKTIILLLFQLLFFRKFFEKVKKIRYEWVSLIS